MAMRHLTRQPDTRYRSRDSAAGLPTARWRCDHFTTLATLTMNDLTAENSAIECDNGWAARFSERFRGVVAHSASSPAGRLNLTRAAFGTPRTSQSRSRSNHSAQSLSLRR
jgi:hypothetical protein